ncbi:TetR/AcrR family transcriptional regulator [Oceanobacillus sp. M60]|uniref:TetR/AcrR family transcriptional regulator n=1 Tax=Oceanobacillus TaxID=182709 RepID=UPI002116D4C8|nr:TetR/AcrR family transcriptional regulator [Oceanobacillus oncorhynchi]UUI39367.1 TetR/AcrR family transcriptional regulator [Oceanobacillus oncorhynchi]
MADRRTKKTQKAIKNTFLTLLEEKELTKITVSEVSNLADIGRGTFYLHYQDIFDLYNQLENELLHQLLQWIDELYGGSQSITLTEFMEKVAEAILQNQKIFKLFMNEQRSSLLLSKVKEKITEKELEDRKRHGVLQNADFEKYNVSFQVSGTIEVLNEWIKTGMHQSPKEISETISRIICDADDIARTVTKIKSTSHT